MGAKHGNMGETITNGVNEMVDKQNAATLAAVDAELMEELSGLMHNYEWAVKVCGRDGKFEMEAIREIAPKAIKALVNYI
jgi:hypothetical protein